MTFNPGNISPDAGLAPNLIPNPPSPIPEAPGIGDAAPPSLFKEAQSIDDIIANLVLDRPLKLYIPEQIKRQFPDFDFRIINSIPQEIADAQNKGFRHCDDPRVAFLFDTLVAGTTKEGAAFRPMLFARPKQVSKIARQRTQRQLQSMYAGMDPTQKELQGGGKYAKRVDGVGMSEGDFSGRFWNIRVER
jgi:hypothetical protein